MMFRRIGSAASSTTTTADASAAAIAARSRSSGASSAMKHNGTAKSSDHAAGIALPAK